MAITCTRLTRGTDFSAPFQTASVSPGADKLLLLCVQVYRSVGTPATPTVSGNGLTWVQVGSTVLYRSDSRSAVFRAMGASPSSGVITITAASSDQVLWSLHEIDGVDTGGTNGSAAIIQSDTNSGTAAASVTVTLAAFASASSAGFGFCARFSAGGTFSPEAGWTEKDDLNGQEVVFRDGTTDNTVTFTPTGSDDMGAIALELAPAPPTTPALSLAGTSETVVTATLSATVITMPVVTVYAGTNQAPQQMATSLSAEATATIEHHPVTATLDGSHECRATTE